MLNDKLHIFAAIYETGGVTRASDILHVTPSAVSQTLNQLEAELGLKLFNRISKKLIPTDAAHEIYKVFSQSTENLKLCLHTLKQKKGTPSGTLKIGAPPAFGAKQVVEIASKFFQYKDARFELTFGLPDQLVTQVIAQDLDFAFCDGGEYLKKYKKLIVYQTVFEEEAILVASKDFHDKYIRDNHTYDHLTTLSHVDYRKDLKVIKLWYQHHFKKSPSTLDTRLIASDVNAMITAALMGMGVAFIPTHLITTHLKHKTLIPIKTKKSPYINPIVLVQKADKVPTVLEKRFVLEKF